MTVHNVSEIELDLGALGSEPAPPRDQFVRWKRTPVGFECLDCSVERELPIVDDVHGSRVVRGRRARIGDNYAESVRSLKPPWYS
jgi:hypothetical protein